MVFIVAEIGVNWDGSFELAEVLIKNAKKIKQGRELFKTALVVSSNEF